MLLRAVLSFLALPTLVAGLVPWMVSQIPAVPLFRSGSGVMLFALGGAALLSSVVSFYRHGRGTLAPWDPPKHLVVRDLYRFTRNPMYLGVITIVGGWALVTGSPWNYLYTVILAVVFHLRVACWEERQMERLFGNERDAYRAAVPRWRVTLRPYVTGGK